MLPALKNPSYHFKQIGLEAGPYYKGFTAHLRGSGWHVICVDARNIRAMLKAQIGKTGSNDARGMAHIKPDLRNINHLRS